MEILVHEPRVAEVIRKAKKQEDCIDKYTATRYTGRKTGVGEGLPVFKVPLMNSSRHPALPT
jgi:hypothetical protein